MSDQHPLQGLWRLVSRVHRGSPVVDPATHYLFDGNRAKEVVPSMVETGELRQTFEIDDSADPKEITFTLDYNGPDGPPDPKPIILKGFYEIDGDALRISFGPRDEFPETFSDANGLVTFERDRGPIPQSQQPSGTPPILDDVLGTLHWDDNLNWYRGEVPLGDKTIDVSLTPDEDGDAAVARARARDIVTRLAHYKELAANYAVDGLLDLANDWNENDEDGDDSEVTAEEFTSRMTLESITVEADGGVTFWHNDGDLFSGHSIQVSIDANDECTLTNIPG